MSLASTQLEHKHRRLVQLMRRQSLAALPITERLPIIACDPPSGESDMKVHHQMRYCTAAALRAHHELQLW